MPISTRNAHDLKEAVRALEGMQRRLVQVTQAGRDRLTRAAEPAPGEPTPGTLAYKEQEATYRHARELREREARAHTEGDIARVEADLQSATEKATRLSSSAGPDHSTPGEAAVGRAWSRLSRQLDAGVSPAELIRGADLAEVVALRQELPAWRRARHAANGAESGNKNRGASRPDTAGADALEQRLADVLGHDTDDGAAIVAGRRARALAAANAERLTGARRTARGDTSLALHSAFRAKYLESTDGRDQAADDDTKETP